MASRTGYVSFCQHEQVLDSLVETFNCFLYCWFSCATCFCYVIIFPLLSLFLINYVIGLMCQKNAAIGGALTGALLSIGDGKYTTDKMVQHAITGGALATASEFVRNLI